MAAKRASGSDEAGATSTASGDRRGDMPELVRSVIARERGEQDRLRATAHWKEGVKAMAERRLPDFKGH